MVMMMIMMMMMMMMNCSCGMVAGNNAEKMWAHWFLEKPNKIAAGGLGGAVSFPECPG